MKPLRPEEEKQRGLSRERLVSAARALVNDDGLDSLSMRSLADQLDVKASSLYWHVRDRRELLELLAESILDGVRLAPRRTGWRQSVLATSELLRARIAAQRDGGRILLEVPDSLERSDVYADLKRQLVSAGLQPSEAGEVALMVMVHVIGGRVPAEQPSLKQASPASVSVDSGSRGVLLRAGEAMQTMVRAAHDQSGVAPGIVRGETVVVRRLRGVGMGEIELDPLRGWRFKIQAPTWNTVVDARGLDVREIHIDSGATKVECLLPMPRGIVPIHVSSGVVDVTIRRPRGAAMTALLHTGAVQVKLDGYASKVVVSDVQWETPGGRTAGDRYELDVSSGAVKLRVDDSAEPVTLPRQEPAIEPAPAGEPASALQILLDGVEARVTARTTFPGR